MLGSWLPSPGRSGRNFPSSSPPPPRTSVLQGVKKESPGAPSASSDLPGICGLQPRGRAWGCMSPASQAREGLPFQGCWERTRCPLSPAWSPPHPQALALTSASGFGSSPRGKGQRAGCQTRRNVWQSADAAPGREQTEAVCLGVICSFSEEPRPGAPERAERRRGRQGGSAQGGGLSHGARGGTPSSAPPV